MPAPITPTPEQRDLAYRVEGYARDLAVPLLDKVEQQYRRGLITTMEYAQEVYVIATRAVVDATRTITGSGACGCCEGSSCNFV